jgi:predicted amidophosphoribosyltransferase
LLEYEGAARQLITALKYRNRRSALPRLVAALAALPLAPVDEITWAPTSTARRRLRGFDQAELVARSLGHRLRVPCRGRLRRVSVGAQTGRSLLERLDGPIFSPRGAPCPRVALIDDVVTTGATLSAAARVLRRAGADEVHAVVVARTPRAT